MKPRLALLLVKAVVGAPARRLAREGVRGVVLDTVGKALALAHPTNPSGNNMSQR